MSSIFKQVPVIDPKRARERVGLSLADAAAIIGLARYSLARFETGQQSPNVRWLIPMANAYGLSGDDVVSLARFWEAP